MADNFYIIDQLVTNGQTVTVTDDGTGSDWLELDAVLNTVSNITLAYTVDQTGPTAASGQIFGPTGGHLIVNGVIENVLGSDGMDYIAGNTLDNELWGDHSQTTGMADTLGGDSGNDTIYGGGGSDVVYGGDGTDSIFGDAGSDTITGDGGIDTVEGGAGADSLSGGATLGDTVAYTASAAGVTVNITFGTTTTGAGGDAAGDSINGFTNVIGSAFADVIIDTVTGTVAFGGNDNGFYGMAGNDTLTMGGGNDHAFGGDGNDHVLGGDGNDVLNGDNNNDTGDGGNGNDTLLGGAGNDSLLGSAGNDSLNGGAGSDTMTGGAGNDTFVADAATDIVTELANGGTDKILSAVTWSLGANLENLTLTGAAAINGSGNNVNNVLTGNSAANILSGLAGNDTIIGGSGADSLNGATGADSLTGGANADHFVFKATGDSTVALHDTISDFKHADADKIDLAGIDAISATGGVNDAFHFITTGFTGHAGELRVQATTGGVLVMADTNGDKVADFEVFVAGVGSLVVGDFVL